MTTQKDVAEKAGVTVTTVSRVINNRGYIAEETRKKVYQVMDELNYRPNAIARGLARNKTDSIGLFLLNSVGETQPYNMEMIFKIMDICNQNGYDILLFSDRKVEEVSYIERCKERGVDGAIIFGITPDDPYLQDIKKSDIPTVIIDYPIQSDKTSYGSSHNKEGAYQAVSYLLSQGHEKVIFMGGNQKTLVEKERLKGYKQAYTDSGITYSEKWIINADFKKEIAYNQILKFQNEFTAVFSISDYMAIGVMEALKDLELNVPQDVSVIGFDDIESATHISPELTTVRQNKDEIGKQTINLLLKLIEGEDNIGPVFVECELIKRNSVSSIK